MMCQHLQGRVASTNVDLKVLSTLLRPPQYPKDCSVEDMLTGLPLREVEDTWLTTGRCGLRFKFSCTSVGSKEDHYSFKKYRCFFPGQVNSNPPPETIRMNEPCKRCGGSGMWEGVDISRTDSCIPRTIVSLRRGSTRRRIS